jgi:hypothetical protein
MAKVWTRGGFRLEMQGDELVVFADADKLAATDLVDVPEVEVLRVSKADMTAEAQRAWKNVKAEAQRAKKNIAEEWARFQKRRRHEARKK